MSIPRSPRGVVSMTYGIRLVGFILFSIIGGLFSRAVEVHLTATASMTTPKPASTASSVQASKPLRLSWVHPFGNPRPSRGNYLSGEQVIERSYCVGRSVTKGIGIGTVANHDLTSDNPNS